MTKGFSMLKHISLFLFAVIISSPAFAQSRGGGSGGVSLGGWAIGLNLGFINSNQKDMNSAIETMNEEDDANTSNLGNAWEVNGMLSTQLASGTVLMLRPSYFFYGAEEGTGTAGKYEYSMSGYTIFPMLRWHLLADQTIKFYSQFGVGYGYISGTIKEQDMDLDFSGGNLGYMFGLGAEFCFFGDHCLNVEGNLRALSVDRMTVDDVSGTAPTGSAITQATKGRELEIRNRDFGATLSGILGMIGYTMYF